MEYQEFSNGYQAVVSLPDEIARKEYDQRREQGQTAVIGVVGVGSADGDVARDFWFESRYRIQSGDEVGPYFFGDGATAVRGVVIWRSSQES